MPFDYATFLDSAVSGEVWLPGDDVHYQDTGRSIVAGDGDPVASLTGHRGNFNATEYTGSNPPILRNWIDTTFVDTAGKWYLEFWGEPLIAGSVSDWKYLHNYVGNEAYCCMAVQVAIDSNPELRYDLLSTGAINTSSQGIVWYWDDSSSFEERVRLVMATSGVFSFADSGSNNSLAPQTDAIIEWTRDVQSIKGYVNGTLIFEGTQPSTNTGNSAYPLTIGANGSGANGLYGRIYGLVVCDTLPDPDTQLNIRLDMDDRLAEPTGVFRTTASMPAGNITFSGLTLPRPLTTPQGAATRVYRVKVSITGISPDELEYVAPVNWQARYAYDRQNFLSVTLHNASTALLEDMTEALGQSPDAGSVSITLQSGYRFSDGSAFYGDLITSTVQTVQTSSGPSSRSTVLSGYLTAPTAAPKAVALGSANILRSGNVARGWIGPIDDNIAPGDQVTLSDTGDSWVVGNIIYRVDARSAIMEVTELTDSTLLAELPW